MKLFIFSFFTFFIYVFCSVPIDNCDSQSAQCCQLEVNASDPAAQAVIKKLDLSIPDGTIVGLNCTSFEALGGPDESNCPPPSKSLCCRDNAHEDEIHIYCETIQF
jgi:hypothetical protein